MAQPNSGSRQRLTGSGSTATSTFTISTLSVGSHSIKAVFTPTGSFLGGSGTLTQAVDYATSTAVTSSSNPATSGQTVTFTATVSNTSSSGGTPTGSIEFFDGATMLGAGQKVSASSTGATFSFATSALSAGPHTIRAVFTPSGTFLTSTGSLAHAVNALTSTAVASNTNPLTFGQVVTFTATVTDTSGTATPTGTVEFFSGTNVLGSGTPLTGTGTSATSTFTRVGMGLGTHTIRAVYTPTGDFLTSNGALTEVVGYGTSTAVSSNNNPSTAPGQSVTFTVTVTNTSGTGGTPTGTIEFYDGSTALGAGHKVVPPTAPASRSPSPRRPCWLALTPSERSSRRPEAS